MPLQSAAPVATSMAHAAKKGPVTSILAQVDHFVNKYSPGSEKVDGVNVSMLRVVVIWASFVFGTAVLLAFRQGSPCLRRCKERRKKKSAAAQEQARRAGLVTEPQTTPTTGAAGAKAKATPSQPRSRSTGVLGSLMQLNSLGRK